MRDKQEKQAQKRHIEDVQRCYDAVKACANLGAALATLTDTVFVMITQHMKTKTDQTLIMGACIKRLREYKKELEE